MLVEWFAFSIGDDILFVLGIGRRSFRSLFWMPSGFVSRCLPIAVIIRAPRPLAFRLRGQDPLLILALGDLQWVRGPFRLFLHLLSSSFLRLLLRLLLSVLVLSLSRG